MQEIKPTRSELIKLKKKIELAYLGHRLLKMKRDGLILEFLRVLKDAWDIRRQINRDYAIAREKMSMAIALEGEIPVQSIAYSISRAEGVNIEMRNIMGILVPEVEYKPMIKKVDERGYGIIGTSVAVSEAVSAFEKVVEDILRAAEIETTIKLLIKNIEKTKRRVNALEFKVIPDLHAIETFITMRLDELERENIFRLKKIKAKGRA
jgi:V/A-type H+-transporting ATPase subunit D